MSFPFSAPPTITKSPQSKGVDILKNITLPCFATGVPPPKVTWKRSDGRVIDFRSKRIQILNSGALFIQGTFQLYRVCCICFWLMLIKCLTAKFRIVFAFYYFWTHTCKVKYLILCYYVVHLLMKNCIDCIQNVLMKGFSRTMKACTHAPCQMSSANSLCLLSSPSPASVSKMCRHSICASFYFQIQSLFICLDTYYPPKPNIEISVVCHFQMC